MPRKPVELNPKASKFWHQGFGVIDAKGVPLVPFIEKATAARIAAQATANTGWAMYLMNFNDCWGYAMAPKGLRR